MRLSDLAALGSFVSGLAVLVSLVFLYFQLRQVTEQIRQAERNQRATIAQVRASRTVDVMLHGCDASMSDAFVKAMRGERRLTKTQLQQFTYFMNAVFVNAEDTFLQRHVGLLEDAAWRAFLALFSQQMARPGFRLAWSQFGRGGKSQEFVVFVDNLVNETPVTRLDTADPLAAWRSGFAELLAKTGHAPA